MFQSIVEAVFHYADATPNKLCLADDEGCVTYAEYAEKIRKYAGCFSEIGFHSGDKIVVEACQSIDYLAIELALHLLGAVFVPVEHNCAADKIASFIQRTKAKAVIVCKEADYDDCECYSYLRLVQMCDTALPYQPEFFPTKEAVSEILFSTGTTGREKGIVLCHANDIALAENVMYGVEMEKDNVEQIPSPMNHSHGLRRYYANMYNGSSVILLGSVMDIMRFFSNIEKYSVTSIDLVPTALTVILKLSKNKLSEYQEQLRYIQLGAAPLMEHDKEKICALLPKTRLYNFYGSTESGCTCIYNFNRPDSKSNCIGKPTHNTSLLIVDDNREPLRSSANHTGLLATKGSMNMLEYWDDPTETQQVLSNGIVYSNDIGYLDADGEVILLGRKGDVINVGGNKVSPEEIENAAKEMPVIVDCGCIPVADTAKGYVPKLFVQIADGEAFNPIAIRTFLASKLEPYKIPQYIEQIEKLPRSYNGKLLRKELRECSRNHS